MHKLSSNNSMQRTALRGAADAERSAAQVVMPQNCTILCPTDEPQRIVDYLHELLRDAAEIRVTGNYSDWSKVEISTLVASLTLNRQVFRMRGDSFSRMILGMHTYFDSVETSAEAVRMDVLDRVLEVASARGVVAEPEFLEKAHDYDCRFGIAEVFKAIIWTGRGVLNAEGKMLLDGEGNSEVA